MLKQLKTTILEDPELLDYEEKILFSRTQELANDINAARAATNNEENKINEYLVGMLNLSDDFENFTSLGSATRRIPANNSGFTGSFLSSSSKLSSLYRAKKSIRASTSRLLRVSVTGDWAPTCALGKDDNFGSAASRNLQVGPDGYLLSFSQSKAFVTSNSKTKREIEYEDRSVSVSVCAKASFGYGTPVVGASVSASACANATNGVRKEEIKSESETNSLEERSSASFAEGLRLAHTPFKNATAGALLGLITNGSENPRIEDVVDVVRIGRQDVIELPAGSEIYFIVNDCSSGSSEGELTVDIHSYSSESQTMGGVVDALIGIRQTEDYRNKKKEYPRAG